MFRAIWRSLGARIAFLMSLAMLPLGLISIYQTQVVVHEAQSLTKAALLSETVAAATGERELIQQALGAAQALASAVETVDADTCNAVLSDFIGSQQLFVFAGFLPVDSAMTCNSSGMVRDMRNLPTFQEGVRRDGPTVVMNRSGEITGQSVIIAMHPIRRNGETIGMLSISIPHRIADALMEDANPNRELKLASINLDGGVVSATSGIDMAPGFLPQDIPASALAQRVGQTFRAVAGDGTERFFAVAPMVDDVLVLVGSWPVAIADAGEGPSARLAIVFPALMWITGIVVAFFGLQRLVVRHIRQLRSAMRQFALGERRKTFLELKDPPEELEEAQRAFNRMVLLISDAEARQEQDLRDKEVLLKEVHHRVKNNLQLIASIMNMQARSARSDEARHMLAGLQRRVRGLAMLHRTLYTTPDLTTVDSAELVKTVVEDVATMSRDKSIKLETELQSVALYPDQAVPLSMLITEALTNAYKYVGSNEAGEKHISIKLSCSEDGNCELIIANTIGHQGRAADESETDGDGLGNRLMTAFVRQLDGSVERVDENNSFAVKLSFPRRDFSAQQKVDDAA